MGVAFLACLGAFYALPAPAAQQYFSIGVGGLGAALALQGLAVAHALSRGLKMRPIMLVALYACCILRAKYTLPVLAGLGAIDGFLKLRSRAGLAVPDRGGISPVSSQWSWFSANVRIRTAIEPAMRRTIPANCKERCQPAQIVSFSLSEMVRATGFAPALSASQAEMLTVTSRP